MAILNIQNAVVANVFGQSQQGARVEERFQTRSGEQASRSYTVFADAPHGLNVGDVVDVSGLMTAKVREYTDRDGALRTIADVILNSPRITVKSSGAPATEDFDEAPF